MSRHKHQHAETKDIKRELQQLQESKQEAETIKAELLEHNAVLTVHPHSAQPTTEPEPGIQDNKPQVRQDFIKDPADKERIARNSARIEAGQHPLSFRDIEAPQNYMGQLIQLQMQFLQNAAQIYQALITSSIDAFLSGLRGNPWLDKAS